MSNTKPGYRSATTRIDSELVKKMAQASKDGDCAECLRIASENESLRLELVKERRFRIRAENRLRRIEGICQKEDGDD